MSKVATEFRDYNDYVEYEWQYFIESPQRAAAMLKAAEKIDVRRVLDVGCGAGQEMLPFVERGALGFGMDITPEVGRVGRRMFAQCGLSEQVSFLRASGNDLPYADASFEVLICRSALMFMDNKKALSEMSRVLRPGGMLFLMFQAPPYYWWKIKHGLRTANPLFSIHAARVLLGGTWYLLSGRQLFNGLTAGGETFQTKKLLARELERVRMKITGELSDTNPQTPSLVIRKT